MALRSHFAPGLGFMNNLSSINEYYGLVHSTTKIFFTIWAHVSTLSVLIKTSLLLNENTDSISLCMNIDNVLSGCRGRSLGIKSHLSFLSVCLNIDVKAVVRCIRSMEASIPDLILSKIGLLYFNL